MKIVSQSCGPSVRTSSPGGGKRSAVSLGRWLTKDPAGSRTLLERISGLLWFHASIAEDGNCLEPLSQRTLPGFTGMKQSH